LGAGISLLKEQVSQVARDLKEEEIPEVPADMVALKRTLRSILEQRDGKERLEKLTTDSGSWKGRDGSKEGVIA
jgi:hypothetical protein